jgi:hypothetical protein
MTDRRLDPSNSKGTGIVDHPSLFGLAYRIGHPRAPDTFQFGIGRIDYPLQIRLQIFDEWGRFSGNRRQFGRP